MKADAERGQFVPIPFPAHGFYSQKMAEYAGSSIFKMEDGTEKECSGVFETPDHRMSWGDVEYVGVVTAYVSRHKLGRKGERGDIRYSLHLFMDPARKAGI